MFRRAWVFAFLMLLAGGACSRGHPDTLPDPNAAVHVAVTNNHGAAMEIFITGGNMRQRLGLVHPGMSASFVVPEGVIKGSTSVELEVRPSLGRERFTSGPLLLSAGAIVDVIVRARLFNSTAVIRP